MVWTGAPPSTSSIASSTFPFEMARLSASFASGSATPFDTALPRENLRNRDPGRPTGPLVTARADLEAVLFDDFSRANLAIYADLLLDEGDDRGELIALDLRIAELGPTDALVARRLEILCKMLGEPAAETFMRNNKLPFQFGFGGVRFGSVSGAYLDAERVLIDSPLGGYLREVRLEGGEKHLRMGIGNLVRRTHPWLQSLRVHYQTSASRKTTPIISGTQALQLIEATPVLETVKITRATNPLASTRHVFASFEHPSVRQLDVS